MTENGCTIRVDFTILLLVCIMQFGDLSSLQMLYPYQNTVAYHILSKPGDKTQSIYRTFYCFTRCNEDSPLLVSQILVPSLHIL